MRLKSSPPLVGGFRIIENPKNPLDDYPVMEQIALLGMLYVPVAKKVASLIQGEDGIQDRPAFWNYQALTEKGLCVRPVGEQWHTLTNEGRRVAGLILALQCKRLNVHDMLEQRNAESVYYKCSCGGWSRLIAGKGGSKQWLRMHQSFSAHVPKDAREIA